MKLRYIIVEDAPFIRELLRGLMTARGHLCVGEAGDGREGRDLVAQTLPDLVFVDLVMPKKNGIAMAKEIRDLWPEAKLIACTTLEQSEAAAPDGLFDAWIAKPFSIEHIDSVLKSLAKGGKEKPA